jgi:hypothetical protein
MEMAAANASLSILKILERELKSANCSVAEDDWSASAHQANVPSALAFFYNEKNYAL